MELKTCFIHKVKQKYLKYFDKYHKFYIHDVSKLILCGVKACICTKLYIIRYDFVQIHVNTYCMSMFFIWDFTSILHTCKTWAYREKRFWIYKHTYAMWYIRLFRSCEVKEETFKIDQKQKQRWENWTCFRSNWIRINRYIIQDKWYLVEWQWIWINQWKCVEL